MRTWTVTAAILGFTGVLLDAFGAHALKRLFEQAGHGADALRWWQTATKYHLLHAVAFLAIAGLSTTTTSPWLKASGWLLLAGVTLFCGTLYIMAVTNLRFLGAVTPLGGLLLLAGWAALAISALQ